MLAKIENSQATNYETDFRADYFKSLYDGRQGNEITFDEIPLDIEPGQTGDMVTVNIVLDEQVPLGRSTGILRICQLKYHQYISQKSGTVSFPR